MVVDVEAQTSSAQTSSWEAAWAIPWSPEAFVDEAVKAGHPKSIHGILPEPLVKAVEAHVNMDANDLDKIRVDWCRRLGP